MIGLTLEPVLTLGLLVSTILPLLVGLVTKTVTNGAVKAVILAALASITGLGTELLTAIQSDRAYDLGAGLVTALTAFLIAVGMHFGIWKPVGAATTLQRIGEHPTTVPANAQNPVDNAEPTPLDSAVAAEIAKMLAAERHNRLAD